MRNFSLSIGIPAHNEETNIGNLIRSLLSQDRSNFTLENIFVLTDGCTDKTEKIVGNLAKEFPVVKLISDGNRKGKVSRLNQIYSLNRSDLLLTLDADIAFSTNMEITEMVDIFIKDRNVKVVGGNIFPVSPKSFVEKVIYTNAVIWNDIRVSVNDGNHISNLYGQATMLSKKFSKTISYPENITCDEEYLYVKAHETNSFRLAKNTRILSGISSSVEEFRLGGTRVLKERDMLVPFFGESVLKLHYIPPLNKISVLMKHLRRDPFFTVLSVLLNLYVRLFPKADPLNRVGQWQPILSSKNISGRI